MVGYVRCVFITFYNKALSWIGHQRHPNLLLNRQCEYLYIYSVCAREEY